MNSNCNHHCYKLEDLSFTLTAFFHVSIKHSVSSLCTSPVIDLLSFLNSIEAR
uniref:Uncharacterized protein n=1 Tax=Octopus bimaculoides TaxID=37653 RepID=A0A0L8HQ42_OCTBM